MNQATHSTENVKTAAANAAAASKQLDLPVKTDGRTRRNLFHVMIHYKGDDGFKRTEYIGAFRNTTEINQALSQVTTVMVDEVQVIFGHERKARRQTKVVFK